MSIVGKQISLSILNEYNGGWIRIATFGNLTLVGGLDNNVRKFDGSYQAAYMEYVIYNNETKEIVWVSGNNMRDYIDNDNLDNLKNYEEILIFLYYNKDVWGCTTVVENFFYKNDMSTKITLKKFMKENKDKIENQLFLQTTGITKDQFAENERSKVKEEIKELKENIENKLDNNTFLIVNEFNQFAIVEYKTDIKNITKNRLNSNLKYILECLISEKEKREEFLNSFKDSVNIKYYSYNHNNIYELRDHYKNILKDIDISA